jgi:hypothetical protein
LADKVLCRSDDGTWIAVSCRLNCAFDVGLSKEADNKDGSACIVTLIRFKYIRDFSISEDLTCKQTLANVPLVILRILTTRLVRFCRYNGPIEYLQLHRGLARLYLRVSSDAAPTATADGDGDTLIPR